MSQRKLRVVTVLKGHGEVPPRLPRVIEGVVDFCFAVEVELVLRGEGSGVVLEFGGARHVLGPGTVFCEEGLCHFAANELAQGRAGYVGNREFGFEGLAHREPFYGKPVLLRSRSSEGFVSWLPVCSPEKL